MKRGALIAMAGGAALAAVAAVGFVHAQENDEPPPLVFDDPPVAPTPSRPPVEEPPPAPGDVPPVITVPVAPSTPSDSAPTVTAQADEPVEEETDVVEVPKVVEKPTPPGKRTRHGAAVIQALDKITAETIRFEAKVGVPVKYRGLVFTLRSCETSASDEPMMDSIAYLQVRAEPRTLSSSQVSREVFKGWMFASSPGLNPLQHPVYDAWVIACKAPAPATAG
ncbi:MAG TPA: DUF2155 domain-containing protein [Caulobacteraceae bacterium]|nr:DUF2155 domain-containing protein [Caulobacteraceae bacterium]